MEVDAEPDPNAWDYGFTVALVGMRTSPPQSTTVATKSPDRLILSFPHLLISLSPNLPKEGRGLSFVSSCVDLHLCDGGMGGGDCFPLPGPTCPPPLQMPPSERPVFCDFLFPEAGERLYEEVRAQGRSEGGKYPDPGGGRGRPAQQIAEAQPAALFHCGWSPPPLDQCDDGAMGEGSQPADSPPPQPAAFLGPGGRTPSLRGVGGGGRLSKALP